MAGGTCVASPDHQQTDRQAAEVVLRATALLGVPYRHGGEDPRTGMDCSGLVRHVYAESVGLTLPRRAEEMRHLGRAVGRDRLRPGDLLFFNTLRRPYSHVALYIGDGHLLHAPARGGVVRIERLDAPFWRQRFDGARRLLDGLDADGSPHESAKTVESTPGELDDRTTGS